MHAYQDAMQLGMGLAPRCVVSEGRVMDTEEGGEAGALRRCKPSVAVAAMPSQLALQLHAQMHEQALEMERCQEDAAPSLAEMLAEQETGASMLTLARTGAAAPRHAIRASTRRVMSPLMADSVKRKRSKKMNKHKYKKRLKAQRRQSRKNSAQ